MGRTRASWTPERRARQADIIRRHRPWTRSTGPKTAAGKAKSSQNALAFRNDPEARVAYLLTKQFLATGDVPPALGELWLAAYLNPVSDNFCNDLFEVSDASDERLDGAATVDSLNDCAWNDREDYRYGHCDQDHGDLLEFFDASHDALADEPVGDLGDPTLDYLPSDIEGDDDDDWFGDDDGGQQLPTENAQPLGHVGDANEENTGRHGHNCDHGDRLDRQR